MAKQKKHLAKYYLNGLCIPFRHTWELLYTKDGELRGQRCERCDKMEAL